MLFEIRFSKARGSSAASPSIHWPADSFSVSQDISDMELKAYGTALSYMTFDFNLDNDVEFKPIAKSEQHFKKWMINYPFYNNIEREGVVLYGAA